jgi:integrase
MAVGKRKVNGRELWVIDRRFRRLSDGHEERYRRVAEVQTRAAADAEERRVCEYYAKHGNITVLLQGEEATPKKDAKIWRWEDAVEHYRRTELPLRKPSVRKSYGAVLGQPLLAYWAGKPLSELGKAQQREWERWGQTIVPNNGTRLKAHIVLRSVLRSVGPEEATGREGVMLATEPTFIPLPKLDEKSVDVPHPEDLDAIMNEGRDGQIPKHCRIRSIRRAQLAYALAIWGGLRAGEVRALRKGDIDVRRRTLTVRRTRCDGEETVTKGRAERVIPIAPLLWERLEPRLKELEQRTDDAHVSVNLHGEPWGDWGIYQAFVRACRRLKIQGSRYHACRHYFATALIEGGADIVTVQTLLGHKELTTTQRYAHFVERRGRDAVAVFSPRAEAAE